MSAKSAANIHIEWAPGRARALDPATGQMETAASIPELAPALGLHRRVIVGVARTIVFTEVLRLPRATEDDLRQILEVRLPQFFPLPPDQLAFDFMQSAERTAEGCLTVIAAIRRDDLRQLRQELQQAGLTATHILPVALGAAHAAAQAGHKSALVVDDTPWGLALDVVDNGLVRFSRTAPATGDPDVEITKTLAAARAESLPTVACGDVELLGAVRAPRPLAALGDAAPFEFELPEERAQEHRQRIMAQTRRAGVLLAMACAGAGWVWFSYMQAMAQAGAGQAAYAKRVNALKTTNAAASQQLSQISRVGAQLDRAFQPAQPLSDLMGVVCDSLPGGAWLTALSVERGQAIQVRGTAQTPAEVADFVSKLGTTGRLRDVRLVSANGSRIDTTAVVQFNVTAVGVGNLPMPAPPKAAKKKPAASVETASAEKGAEQ